MPNQALIKTVFSAVMSLSLVFLPGVSRAQDQAAAKPSAAVTPKPIKMGIITNYGGVVVRNLPIGRSVSMQKLSNLPLVIKNNYPGTIFVWIETTKPEKLLEEYESIPDPSWVKVESTGVTIPAKAEAKLDVVITIPDQEALMGRKFQTSIQIRTNGPPKGFIKFGSHNTDKLFFSVAKVKDDQFLNDALAKPRDTAFDFTPARIDLYHMNPGQKVEVKDNGQAVVIKNTSNKKQTYYLTARGLENAVAQADPGSQPANPNDVLVSPEEVTLKPGEAKELNITVQIPADLDLAKGPLFCLISAKSGLSNWAEKYFRVVLHAGAKLEPKDPAKEKSTEKP